MPRKRSSHIRNLKTAIDSSVTAEKEDIREHAVPGTSSHSAIQSHVKDAQRMSQNVVESDSKCAVEQQVFLPLDWNRQKQLSSRFGIPLLSEIVYANCGHELKDDSGIKLTYMIGDGNCFYRGLSYVMTGDQKHHSAIRRMVYCFQSEHRDMMAKWVEDVDHHIERTRTLDTAVSEVDVLATASLLNVPIFIHQKSNGDRWEWQKYLPGTFDSICEKTSDNGGHYEHCVYLVNTADDHIDVVTGIGLDVANSTYFCCARAFTPPNGVWQASVCYELGLTVDNILQYEGFDNILSDKIDVYLGSGHDFFDAVATAIAGESQSSEILFLRVLDYMLENRAQVQLLLEANQSVLNHVRSLKKGEPVSSVDILCCASLLGADIYINRRHQLQTNEKVQDMWTWRRYPAYLLGAPCKTLPVKTIPAVYLSYAIDNHFGCVLAVRASVDDSMKKSESGYEVTAANPILTGSSTETTRKRVELKNYRSRSHRLEYKRLHKLQQRQDTQFRGKEKHQKRAARADDVKGAEIRKRDTPRKRAARANVVKGAEIREYDTPRKRAARADDVKGAAIREHDTPRKRAARADDAQGAEIREKNTIRMRSIRADEVKGPEIRERDTPRKRSARADVIKGVEIRERDTQRKRSARADDVKGTEIRERDTPRKRFARADDVKGVEIRKADILRKVSARSNSIKGAKIQVCDRLSRKRREEYAIARNLNEKNRREAERAGTLLRAVNAFLKSQSVGPDYICSVCERTFFAKSVTPVNEQIREKDAEENGCLTGLVSKDGREWICWTCRNHVSQSRIPKLSVRRNNMAFPDVPDLIRSLKEAEQRCVSPRIPFTVISERPRGGQYSLKGNVVNVPVSVTETVNCLPRNLDETQTIHVEIKRRKQYKTAPYSENVRPAVCFEAVRLLNETSVLYRKENVTLADWEDWNMKRNSHLQHFDEVTIPVNGTKAKDDSEDEGDVQISRKVCCQRTKRPVISDSESESDIQRPVHSRRFSKTMENKKKHEVNESDSDSDAFSEVDMYEGLNGVLDTFLDNPDIELDDQIDYTNRKLILAPGENERPSSLYHDQYAEFLAFLTIYGGQIPPENPIPVSYGERCKWELMHMKRYSAESMANIFFKLKKLQLNQMNDKVNLAMRRAVGTKGQRITAKDLKDGGERITRLDEGYRILGNLRNSPAYFESRKKDVFAMIHQLGKFTFFVSLSAAETHWTALIRTLAKLQLDKDLSDEDIENMTWEEKNELIRKDPVTCTRYFDNRVGEFFKDVLYSESKPIGKVMDFFSRIEFQQRGSPHVHVVFWIENAPDIETDPEKEVTEFIDKYISCSSNVPESDQQWLKFQTHRHSTTCRKNGRAVCRFNYPLPPMRASRVLGPLQDEELDDKDFHRSNYRKVVSKLDEMWKNAEGISFDEYLNDLEMDETTYILAIRSSLRNKTVFLKREPCEIRINAYMKNLLGAWQANHDIQYVIDAYAAAVYVVSYMAKSMRGMSLLMRDAVKEARRAGSDLRSQMRHLSNKFSSCVEISAQEACYLILGLSLTKASRRVTFIQTTPPDERTCLLRPFSEIQLLDDDSTDIRRSNFFDRYAARPVELESVCLADFVSRIEVSGAKKKTEQDTVCARESDEEPDHIDLGVLDDENENVSNVIVPHIDMWTECLPLVKDGKLYRLRKNPQVIRTFRYNRETDSENYYRSNLLLYLPWRNELADLACRGSYEDKFNQHRDKLWPKMKQYNRMGEGLDIAIERAMNAEENEDEFDRIAPGAAENDAIDAEKGSRITPKYALFLPQNIQQASFDTAIEFNARVAHNDDENTEQRTRIMTNEDFYAGVRSLNREQREIFTHIMQMQRTSKVPYCIFLSGGAGTGKSHVVNMLYQALHRELACEAGENPEEIRISLCAPTGKAAFGIGGATIHHAFDILPNRGYDPIAQILGDSSLNTLRSRYRKLEVCIIDEVSMVGKKMLDLLDLRLRKITGLTDRPFGGIRMIFVGDLFQLKPVMDSWVFEYPNDVDENASSVSKPKRKQEKVSYTELGPNLWRDHVYLYELTEIMRQKDDKAFAEMLNRFREGKHTDADLAIIKSRRIDPEDVQSVTHLCCLNETVDAYNKSVYEKAKQRGIMHRTVEANDGALSNNKTSQRVLAQSVKDGTARAGLKKFLDLAVGLRYEISVNLSVEDGLMNGSPCVLRYFHFLNEESRQAGVPDIVWVEFDSAKVGIDQRSKLFNFRKHDIDQSWVPIHPVRREYMFSNHRLYRVQFPLRAAAAKTNNTAQGDTMKAAVIDHTWKVRNPHSHYVAFSRVTSLSGLYVRNVNRQIKRQKGDDGKMKWVSLDDNPDENYIHIDKHVQNEMKRLRNDRYLELCYRPLMNLPSSGVKIAFHNARSLHKHIHDVRADPNYTATDVLAFAETRLCSRDKDDDFSMDGFSLERFDMDGTVDPQRPARGMAVFISDRLHGMATIELLSGLDGSGGIELAQWTRVIVASQNTLITIMYLYINAGTTWPNYRQWFEQKLNLLSRDHQVVILGDFNKVACPDFLRFMRSRGWNAHIDTPTTLHGSKLDLIFSNCEDADFGSIYIGWSDHSMTWAYLRNQIEAN